MSRPAIRLRSAPLGLLACLLSWVAACGDGVGGEVGLEVPGRAGAVKTAAVERARRRAYDGAPPVTPHPTSGGFAGQCETCHTERGLAVEGLGFAPPSPHGGTDGMGAARCQQCHLERITDELFRPNSFEGLTQDLRRGDRQHDAAPPILPHPLFMRESCTACHDGPAAREELRCTHPERANCLQCHLERRAATAFAR